MRNFVLLISSVAILLSTIEAKSYGENLIARLNIEIDRLNDLIIQVQEHYREQPHEPLPRNYGSTLRRAGTTIGRALKLMRNIEGINRQIEDKPCEDVPRYSVSNERERNYGVSARRSNDDLKWNENFYKALSRALKDQFKDEPIIQENIHEGFVPPTMLKKRNRQ